MPVALLVWFYALLVASTLIVLPARAQELWFSPPDDHPRGKEHFTMAEGFTRMFRHPEEWSFAAAHVNVFGIDMWSAIDAPEEKMRLIFDFLKSRNIAVNVGLQSVYTEGCGKGVEGLNQVQKLPGDVARRLKRLGSDVAYFSLDGPLGFGHTYKGKEACRYSVREVAHRLAYTVADVRSSYPNAKFVDYEGDFTQLPPEEGLPLLREWLQAYREETGTELDALGMDADWRKSWRRSAPPTVDILHGRGVKAGIFITATGGKTVTDESWMTEAKQNIRDVTTAKLPLDFVILASWMFHPWRLIPEDDPLTLTHLVDWYLRYREGKQ
jgi:hypothetical protein